MGEKIEFEPDVLAKVDGVMDAAFAKTLAIVMDDPRWSKWTDKERVLHHFVLTMNVAGALMLSAAHAIAMCGEADIEQINYYLDDWTGFETEEAKRICDADFEVGLFFRVKKHDGECVKPKEDGLNG